MGSAEGKRWVSLCRHVGERGEEEGGREMDMLARWGLGEGRWRKQTNKQLQYRAWDLARCAERREKVKRRKSTRAITPSRRVDLVHSTPLTLALPLDAYTHPLHSPLSPSCTALHSYPVHADSPRPRYRSVFFVPDLAGQLSGKCKRSCSHNHLSYRSYDYKCRRRTLYAGLARKGFSCTPPRGDSAR